MSDLLIEQLIKKIHSVESRIAELEKREAYPASTSPDINTLVARDGSGDINVNGAIIQGTANMWLGANIGTATGAGTGDVKFSGSLIGTGTEALRTAWTPTLVFATPGTSSFTYANNVGLYSKIGSVVFFAVRIVLSAFSAGTASGTLRLGGLPFTVLNNIALPIASVGFTANWTTSAPDRGFYIVNTTQIQLQSSTASSSTLGTGNVTATSQLWMSGSYFT